MDITYYIFANGEDASTIHSYVNNQVGWTNVTVKASDYRSVERTIQVQEENGKYRFKDASRNIETYKTKYEGGFLGIGQSAVLPGDLIESGSVFGISYTDKINISTHANMETVYDYYNNNLNWRSFDGNGATIKSSTQYATDNKGWFTQYNNAYWSPSIQQFVFGNDGHYMVALDVVSHEFTHAVVNYIVGNGSNISLTYQGESGALNEALADIMGNLIEDKTNSGRWLLAEDSDRTIRDMSNPTKYGQPAHYNNMKYVGQAYDNGGVHYNSGVINFAAYKMMTDSRTSSISRTTWAKLFFKSLYRLEPDATFLNFRGAVINTAKRLGFNHDHQQAIKDAFDDVGVVEPDAIRIVLTWNENPRDLDSHIVGPGINGGRFHVYYEQRSYDLNGQYDTQNSLPFVDLDYDDTTSYGPEVTTIHSLNPGTYYFYVHDYTNGGSTSSNALALSGATVKLFWGTNKTPIATYHVNTTTNGIYWNVCKITINSNGTVGQQRIDTYGYEATLQ